MWKKSVAQWLEENYPDYDRSLTVSSDKREPEKEMIEAYGAFSIKMPPYSYKRYGYALSHLVAQHFAHSIGALELGFSARLTNCGMAAISTILDIINKHGMVLASKVLYPETRHLLANCYKGKDCYVGATDLVDCLACNTTLVFLESVGNGLGMPIYDLESVFRRIWKDEVTVVLDNTLLTCCLLNPFEIYAKIQKELGSPKMQLIYVESLSKYYRTSDNDLITAGIIVGPNDFIKKVDEVIMRNGAYLQLSCLEKLPFDLFAACSNIMPQLCKNAEAAAEFLRKHSKVKEVFYPDLPNGAGGVLYFIIEDSKIDEVIPLLENEFGAYMGSFGHSHTTWVPFGKLVKGNPKGLIRLAVGCEEKPQEIVRRLENVLG